MMNSGALTTTSAFTAPVKLNNLTVSSDPPTPTKKRSKAKIVKFDGSIQTHSDDNPTQNSSTVNEPPKKSRRDAQTKATKNEKTSILPSLGKEKFLFTNSAPKPWRFKSKKQRAREKRKTKRNAMRKKANKERESQRLKDDGINGENYTPLCDSFPTLNQSRTVFLRCKNEIGEDRTELGIESRDGTEVATLLYTKLKTTDRHLASGRRILRDANGITCAMIFHNKSLEGKNTFKICGARPMSNHHTISADSGYYTWAEVHNTGEFNPEFCLTIRRDAEPSGKIVRFKTKSVGSRYLGCCFKEPRGFSIYHKTQEGKNLDGCGKLSFYNDIRGLLVSQNMDYGLMLCYAVVIDEMMERRMR